MNDTWTKGGSDDLAKYFHQDMVTITATDQMIRIEALAQ